MRAVRLGAADAHRWRCGKGGEAPVLFVHGGPPLRPGERPLDDLALVWAQDGHDVYELALGGDPHGMSDRADGRLRGSAEATLARARQAMAALQKRARAMVVYGESLGGWWASFLAPDLRAADRMVLYGPPFADLANFYKEAETAAAAATPLGDGRLYPPLRWPHVRTVPSGEVTRYFGALADRTLAANLSAGGAGRVTILAGEKDPRLGLDRQAEVITALGTRGELRLLPNMNEAGPEYTPAFERLLASAGIGRSAVAGTTPSQAALLKDVEGMVGDWRVESRCRDIERVPFDYSDRIDVTGMHWRCAGARGTPLIMVHGGPFDQSDLTDLKGQVYLLLSRGYEVYEIAYHGDGYVPPLPSADEPDRELFAVDARLAIEQVRALLRRLQAEHPTVVLYGESLGGYLGSFLAADMRAADTLVLNQPLMITPREQAITRAPQGGVDFHVSRQEAARLEPLRKAHSDQLAGQYFGALLDLDLTTGLAGGSAAPVLVVVAEADANVGMDAFPTLRERLGDKVEWLTFPGREHSFTPTQAEWDRFANRLDALAKRAATTR